MSDRTKATIMIDTELWKRLKIISVINEFEISELVEEALREKLARIQQPEQYQEYKDVEDLRYKPRTVQQQQPQSKSSVLSLTVNLPGIEFPANKSRIIKHAEEANSDRVVNALNKLLSNKEYKNKLELQTELSKEAKTTKVDFAKEGRTMVFEIDDRRLRKEQYKERSLEQENKIGIIK